MGAGTLLSFSAEQMDAKDTNNPAVATMSNFSKMNLPRYSSSGIYKHREVYGKSTCPRSNGELSCLLSVPRFFSEVTVLVSCPCVPGGPNARPAGYS